jgi:hypothetical protein
LLKRAMVQVARGFQPLQPARGRPGRGRRR